MLCVRGLTSSSTVAWVETGRPSSHVGLTAGTSPVSFFSIVSHCRHIVGIVPATLLILRSQAPRCMLRKEGRGEGSRTAFEMAPKGADWKTLYAPPSKQAAPAPPREPAAKDVAVASAPSATARFKVTTPSGQDALKFLSLNLYLSKLYTQEAQMLKPHCFLAWFCAGEVRESGLSLQLPLAVRQN